MTAAEKPHVEPEEVFLPLSDRRYAEFYSIEMDGQTGDIQFYLDHCLKGTRILELGCGTGRIGRALANAHRSVVGIDLSLPMLRQLTNIPQRSLSGVCMDMTAMAFREKFNTILIPHNTLNLVRDITSISRCLQQSCHLLKPSGSLLLQLHIPDKELLAACNKKIFQFKIFQLPGGQGKLIKETLLSFHQDTTEIHLEERYRLRQSAKPDQRRNFKHTLKLAGFPVEQWIWILRENGFSNLSLFGNDGRTPFHNGIDSRLFICADAAPKG